MIKSFDNEHNSFIVKAGEPIDENIHILGRLEYPDGHIEYHAVNHEDLYAFEPILEHISCPSIRQFTRNWLSLMPEYVFYAPASSSGKYHPASSSGKYHPASSSGKGGLRRHIINVARMMIYITELEFIQAMFETEQIDIMISACLLHDMLKSGWQEDYEQNKHTRRNHPALAADAIACSKDGLLSDDELEMLTDCIRCHMGQWNDNGNLPKPVCSYEFLVHLADYLASRRDISIANNDIVYAFDTQRIFTINSFTKVSSDDLALLKTVMNNTDSINLDDARDLGILRDESEIRDIWKSILESKSASTKQRKYIALAKVIYVNMN
jgi:hypothetical protein